MRVFFRILLVAGFVSCNNGGDVKKEADTLAVKVEKQVNDALNSETADSIRSKGGKILEDVKTKSEEVWDSAKSKGGKLIERGDRKWNDLTKRDSFKANN